MSSVEDKIMQKIFTDVRPWGNFRQFTFNEICTVKILTVNRDQVLSKQRHQNRDELWHVIDDGLRIEIDDKIIDPKPGDEVVIPRKSMHRLSSRGKTGRVLEISFGEFDENDIERFDDKYGRS